MITRILEFFRAWPQSWWALQIIPCTTIFFCNVLAGKFGLRPFTYGANLVNVILITGWAFALSYDVARPIGKISAAWFMAQAALTFFGLLMCLIFKEAITLNKVFGFILIALGTWIYAFGRF